MSETTPKYVYDADGRAWVYRLVSSRLERRDSTSRFWFTVEPGDFVRMIPAELRHIADILESSR